MAYFGTDGDSTAGIVPNAPTGAIGEQTTAQNVLHLCGGQVSEAGTPTHVSIYCDSYDGVTASDHYIAVFKGGSASDPSGATLIGVTANITANLGDDSMGWETFALTGTSAWAAGDYVWFGIIGRGSNANWGMRPRATYTDATQKGDYTAKGAGSFDYLWTVTDGSSGSPSSTVPSGGAWQAQLPFIGYITYTAAGGDTTAPVLTSPTGTATSGTTATVGATTDEGNGTLYCVVTTSATQPSVAQIKAGNDHTGSAAAWSGNVAVSSAGAKTLNATGLTTATTYYAHFVHTDAAANDSVRVYSLAFTAADKKLKLLLDYAAVGATVAKGIAWAPQSGSLAGAEYGEFSGQIVTAGSGADTGYGVLKVLLSAIGSPALSVGDTVKVYVESSTHYSPVWPATVIEE